MNWYLEPWKKYAQFSGRACRSEFWTFALINMLIGFVLWVPSIASLRRTGSPGLNPLFFLYFIFLLVALLPSIACTVRRLHDSGKSGWWYFIAFVPLVGGLILLVFLLLGGNPGANKYGPNPRATYERSASTGSL